MHLLAGFLDEQADESIINLYKCILCINTELILFMLKNLPRDMVVQLLTKKTKEDIRRTQYRHSLEIDGKI